MSDPKPNDPKPNDSKPDDSKNEFLDAAGQEERGLIAEFVAFMSENKMWWLAPILIVFLLLGVLLLLGATGVAPFLYSFV